jgi:3-oxoacyl-[acyl-carrier-protein] synthase-3
VSAAEVAAETGIPPDVVREKLGIRQIHRAGKDCHVAEMATMACLAALNEAGISPNEIDLVVYCGSEYKDFIVWSAAARIAHSLGCRRAEAFEIYALCAGMPIALRTVKNMMMAESETECALVVAASKESALVDRGNQRTRFMFNFGDGAAAAVLRRGLAANVILGSASLVDGSLSESAIMPAGGSRQPASLESITSNAHFFDVPDGGWMRDRLDEVSGANFLAVAGAALQRSGRSGADFLAPVHVKRSMHLWLQDSLHTPHSYYLEDYGHMQAADQLVALQEGYRRGLLREGDTALLVAAGVGYTWSATVVAWGPQS